MPTVVDLWVGFRYVQIANFGNFDVFKICQIWQPTMSVNFGNWWYLPILAILVPSKFAKFGNRQRLLILVTDDTCQFWQFVCCNLINMLWQYSYRQVEKMLCNKMHTETMNKCYQKWRLTNWRGKVAKSGKMLPDTKLPKMVICVENPNQCFQRVYKEVHLSFESF